MVGGAGVGLAKYFMYDGQCENGESVFTLIKGAAGTARDTVPI